MDIGQQQELKSEKRTTKQGRKSIPFTDLSIKNWRLESFIVCQFSKGFASWN